MPVDGTTIGTTGESGDGRQSAPPSGALEPGATVLVCRGRYALEAGVIDALHPDLGAHGFATIRFIGLSGTPLKRQGQRTYTPGALPPLDVLPVTALSFVAEV